MGEILPRLFILGHPGFKIEGQVLRRKRQREAKTGGWEGWDKGSGTWSQVTVQPDVPLRPPSQ